ncbi:MAG: methyltransferase [Thaumarchaeota archaeon]|nr:methyltransferase [Nitrososphaerota archaeon]
MQNRLVRTEEYSPAEDTYFLEDHIKNEKGNTALDVGTGSGYLAKSLSKSFSFVVATDISFNILKNQTYKTQNIVCCNGADALSFNFDLVVCNLPYLETDEVLDIATDGGKEGIEIPIKIIKSTSKCVRPEGKFLFVTSSLSNYARLMEITTQEGFEVKILAKKKLFFEELILVEARKK